MVLLNTNGPNSLCGRDNHVIYSVGTELAMSMLTRWSVSLGRGAVSYVKTSGKELGGKGNGNEFR